MQGEQEIFFQCPHCWQTISMVLETYYPNQTYIEDCEVCCRPIEISYKVSDNEEVSIEVKSLDE